MTANKYKHSIQRQRLYRAAEVSHNNSQLVINEASLCLGKAIVRDRFFVSKLYGRNDTKGSLKVKCLNILTSAIFAKYCMKVIIVRGWACLKCCLKNKEVLFCRKSYKTLILQQVRADRDFGEKDKFVLLN